MKNQFLCTNCAKQFPSTNHSPRCAECGEPLSFATIQSGSINELSPLKYPFWQRYRDFYPYVNSSADVSLGEGYTPLTSLAKLADELDLDSVYVKNETINPTWSFKDRGTALGVLFALNLGYTRIGTVSTGNMAASVAAYGARADLETFILVKGDMAVEKVSPIAIYNPKLIRVFGDYGQLYDTSLKIGADNQIYFINSDVPIRVEGSKSIAFEICEQLAFNAPDYVVIPTSAGGNFRGIMKGFREFYNAGLIDSIPRPICAQSTGCAPIVKAYQQRSSAIKHFGQTSTIAHGIGNPSPPSGNAVLRLLTEYNGSAVAVSNEEIVSAQKQLAACGIFGQPASAVPLAAVKKLRQDNTIEPQATVAVIATGSGLKYTAAFEYHQLQSYETKVAELELCLKSLLS